MGPHIWMRKREKKVKSEGILLKREDYSTGTHSRKGKTIETLILEAIKLNVIGKKFRTRYTNQKHWRVRILKP